MLPVSIQRDQHIIVAAEGIFYSRLNCSAVTQIAEVRCGYYTQFLQNLTGRVARAIVYDEQVEVRQSLPHSFDDRTYGLLLVISGDRDEGSPTARLCVHKSQTC